MGFEQDEIDGEWYGIDLSHFTLEDKEETQYFHVGTYPSIDHLPRQIKKMETDGNVSLLLPRAS